MPIWTDDRGETPHGRGATDAAHLAIPAMLWPLDLSAMAVWCGGLGVAQIVQVWRADFAWAAWRDAAHDVAVTAGGAALAASAVPAGDDAGAGWAALAAVGALYAWRQRKAWGLL